MTESPDSWRLFSLPKIVPKGQIKNYSSHKNFEIKFRFPEDILIETTFESSWLGQSMVKWVSLIVSRENIGKYKSRDTVP